MIKRILRYLLPVGIIVLAVVGFGALKSSEPEVTPEVPKARQWLVNALPVNKQALIPTVTLFGRVVTPSNSVLSSILDAEVIAVRVLPGQSVAKGDVLVRLDSQTIETQIRQYEAEVARIKASIDREAQRLITDEEILTHEQRLRELATESLSRHQTLKSRNVISQAEFDASERAEQQARLAVTARHAAIREYTSRVAVLEAELQRAQATLDKARLDLEQTIIVAPYNGRVTDVYVAMGNRVRNGSALIGMYDQTLTEIRTLLPNRYIFQVRETIANQHTLQAVAKLDGQLLSLTLDRLGTTVDPGRGGIDAYFQLTDQSLYPELGRSISLDLSLSPVENAIALPYQAVYGSNQVFKIEANQLKQVEIERYGQYHQGQESYIVATSGQLENGDLVLITQLSNAIEGLAVTVEDTVDGQSSSNQING